MDPINRLLAQIPLGPLTGPGIAVTDGVDATTKLELIIGQIIAVMSILAVIYFIFQIIIAGYNFINSEGDEKKMEMSRHRLTEGVLGLTIVIIALGLGSLLATLAGIPNVLDFNQMFDLMNL